MTTGLLGVGVSFAEELSGVVTVRGVTTATVGMGSCRAQGLTLPSGERTWTVLGAGHRVVGPAEEYLEYLRAQQVSPNTVKSYARALALWWQFLELFGLDWDAVTLENFGAFLTWLRTGDEPEVVSIERRRCPVCRVDDLRAAGRGDLLLRLSRAQRRGRGPRPAPDHSSWRRPVQAAAGTRRPPQGPPAGGDPGARTGAGAAPPILTPVQIERICEACASWDTDARQWRGSVRNRLLWMLLAETGVRVGEALGLQHRDWHTGCGDTPYIEVVDRDHPHGVRAKSGYRRVYVSDQLDRLYGEYVWQLCEAGADLATDDFDGTCVFVNLDREPRFAPWRAESVYDLVDRLRRQLSGQVPQAWTPHWMRHSHATALLLSGVPVHVVSRRLGHVDVQTTLNTYAHVTEDAEMRAVADWKAFTAGWRVGAHCDDERIGSGS